MNDVLTIPVNMAGLPGMSVPAGFVDGLPVGMQFIANRLVTRLFEQVPGGNK